MAKPVTRRTQPRPLSGATRAADAAEVTFLRHALCRQSPLSVAELEALAPPQRCELPAGTAFLRAGERASEVAVVHSGGLREYFVLPDGTERTKGFSLPGDFAGSLADLLVAGPARAWVVAEVPTVLLTLQWSNYQGLVESMPGWQRFARSIAEDLYLRKAQREYELLALDAAARYRTALQRWPQLEQVFRQRHIASYVGVTPVHLSRLRAKLPQAWMPRPA